MRKAILFATALLTLPVLPAVAADNGFYLGGSVGQVNLKIDDLTGNVFPDDDFDSDDTAFKLIAGIRPLDWLAVEAAYVNFGEPEDTVVGTKLLKNVPKAFVVVANHSSHLDAPLIMGALPRKQARYLAAGAAADYFFDVWWRRGLTALFFNAFPVDRSGSNPRSVSAKSLLDRGVPLLVFPEGTRSKTGEMGRFKPGAASLAIASDVPCVPVALIGAGAAHPRG